MFRRLGSCLPGQAAVETVRKGIGKTARSLRRSAKPLTGQFHGIVHHPVKPLRQ